MCVRAARGLLRHRSGPAGPRAPAALGFGRGASRDVAEPGPSSATDGLAQAILQERLAQQQSQVRRLARRWPLDSQ